MSKWRYDLFQTPVGWVALLASDKGLRRLSLKPTPQEAMEELGPEMEGAAHLDIPLVVETGHARSWAEAH